MDVDSPLRENKKAYIFISTHGEYKFTKNEEGIPQERENDIFKLGDTNIQKLTWVRSVPGGVANFCPEEAHVILERFYQPYKWRIQNYEDMQIDILSDTIKSFKKFGADIEPSKKDYKFDTFLKSLHKHYQIHHFTSGDEILNKFYLLSQAELKETIKKNNKPDTDPDNKIVLLHYDEGKQSVVGKDITKELMTSRPDKDGLISTSVALLLLYLSQRGYKEVEMLDLTCAEVLVDDDLLSATPIQARSIMRGLSKKGGRKSIRKSIRKKKRRKSTKNKSYKALNIRR
jgi:hypothetical protein